MSTLSGYDAAFPPGTAPAGDQVVMGYLGGDTPHPWSLSDWNSQPARFRIPIWTRDNPAGHSGTTEGNAALAVLDSLRAPRGILVVLDYEMAQDAVYLAAFDAVMVSAGNKLAVYGSTSTLFHNPKPSGGYFPADLTGTPHLYPGALLTQYAFESAWDDDTISAAAVLWDTQGGTDMAITQADAEVILNLGMPKISPGTPEDPNAGNTSLYDLMGRAQGQHAQVLAAIAAVSTPEPAAVAAALAANPAFVKGLAHAVVVELRNDLPAA